MLLNEIRSKLANNGASLVGFADLSILDPKVRGSFTTGISIAVALDPNIIENIKEGPTREYYSEYLRVNEKLNFLSSSIARFINGRGYRTGCWGATEDGIYGRHMTDLPHKTMATLSGLGWIGKCALLVTKEFGSAVRLTTVLTDIEESIEDRSISESSCGDCDCCVKACPGHAPNGTNWHRGLFRDEFFDPDACRETAQRLAREKAGIENTICGICIASCRYTMEYMRKSSVHRGLTER